MRILKLKRLLAPAAARGGKGIGLAALDPCFALELRSHPFTGGKGIDLAALDPCFALELRSHPLTGGKGIRTPGLLIANETLYQLSYTPLRER